MSKTQIKAKFTAYVPDQLSLLSPSLDDLIAKNDVIRVAGAVMKRPYPF